MPNLNHPFLGILVAVCIPMAAWGKCTSGFYEIEISIGDSVTTECAECPGGYTSDAGATAQAQCYQNRPGDGYAIRKCYYFADRDACRVTNSCNSSCTGITCNDCNFTCDTNYHIEGTKDDDGIYKSYACMADERDCVADLAVNGYKSCITKWDATKEQMVLDSFECLNDNWVKVETLGECKQKELNCEIPSYPNATACKLVWDMDKLGYAQKLTCDDGYLPQTDENTGNETSCKTISETSCKDYLKTNYKSIYRIVYPSGVNNDTGYMIDGYLGAKGSKIDFSGCLRTKQIATQSLFGRCHEANHLVIDSNNKPTDWSSTTVWTDCECNEYYCESATAGCAIPESGWYYDKNQRTCVRCKNGGKTDFGTDNDAYQANEKRTAGVGACFVDKGTKFCDSHGCFYLGNMSGRAYWTGN